jgi:antirestriction protein
MLNVFLSDLQAYNEGHLVGRFITLPISENKLAQAISEVLREGEAISDSNNHEEFFLTDWEWGDVEFFSIDEYDNIYELNAKLQAIEEVEAYKHKAIAFLLSEGLANDLDDAISKADDVRVYEGQSMEDIAYDLLQECYGVDTLPSIIANHIDYGGIARDLEMDGTYFEMGNDIFEYIG